MKNSILMASALLALGGLTTGCASTASGQKSSVITSSVPSENLRSQVPAGAVLAVIRYPAVVEEDARDVFHRAYARRAIGEATGRGVVNTIETVAVADSTVIKSNYFALSLYKELAAILPEHSVLLSPHAIKLNEAGSLTSEPMTGAEDIPSVVSIDFSTYSYPDSRRMMEDVALTFGDLVTPLVTVRTDHRAAAPTNGLLLASYPLVTRASAEGYEIARETIREMQAGRLDPVIAELDFVSFITNDTPRRSSVQKLTTRPEKNAVLLLPVEKIRIPEEEMRLLLGESDGTVDPIDELYTEDLASRIVALVNGLDHDRAIMMRRAASISKFDPSLAALTFVGSDEADYTARVSYADRLLDTERKYLSVQSLRIFDGIHHGELGALVRDMIAAEKVVLDQRRALGGQENVSKVLAVPAFFTGIGAAGSIFAATEAYSRAQLSRQVGANYLNSIVPALEQQTSVTLDLIDSNETITAIRYEDLQTKLQTLYADNQRSLETVATQCGYIGENGTKRGTWLGVCENGLANGSGAGVLKTSSDLMEFYGYAKDGLADGPGLMIRHTGLGSISYEGTFAKGRPHGTIRVSTAGKADQIRKFDNGINKGSSKGVVASPFDGVVLGVSK